MRTITAITLKFNDGGLKTLLKTDTKWLFIAQQGDEWGQILLTGDDVANAFLLRVLENGVVQQMNETQRIGVKP